MTDYNPRKLKDVASRYFWNILIAIDQLANTLLAGDPDETISSRMGKQIREGKCKLCKIVCRLLHRVDPNHCENSIEADRGDRGL